MRLLPCLFVTLAALGVTSCTPKQDADTSHNASEMDEKMHSAHSDAPEVDSPEADKEPARVTLSDDQRQEILRVLEVNERLHAAFFTYDAQMVEKEAQALASAIENVSASEVSERLQQSKEYLGNIKASAERKQNNQNYHLVSMALIHVVNNFEVGSEYQGHSCPMVKMQWLQNTAKTEKILNPYAPEMPNCGEVLDI